jgi:probable rRNA maturation factor
MPSQLPPRRLDLSVQYALTHEALPERGQIRTWVRAADPGAARITVRFVDRQEGQTLNAGYRHKDYATNVLSFPYETEPILLGDLVLCWPVVLEEAAAQSIGVEAHCAHLIVHGVLHLQGWDHETEEQAEEMEAQERIILASLGYPDPYAIEKD